MTGMGAPCLSGFLYVTFYVIADLFYFVITFTLAGKRPAPIMG